MFLKKKTFVIVMINKINTHTHTQKKKKKEKKNGRKATGAKPKKKKNQTIPNSFFLVQRGGKNFCFFFFIV